MPTRKPGGDFSHSDAEAERLTSLRSLEIVGGPHDDFLDDLVRWTAARFRAPIAQINFVGADYQWTMAAIGGPRGVYIDREICFCAHTIQQLDRPTIIGDASSDARFVQNPLVTQPAGIRFYAGASIKDPEGRAIGAICVADTVSRSPASVETADLMELARIVSARLDYFRVSARLRESEENYRASYDLNPQLPFTCTPDGQVEETNPRRWLSLVGNAQGMPRGDGWQRAVHPDDLPSVMAVWRVALRTSEPLDTEYRLRHDDGEYQWFRARAAPRRDANGVVLRWYGTLENIDDHKRATLALWRSEQKLRFAMEAGGLGSWDLDFGSGVVTASEICATHLGLPAAARIASRADWLAALHKTHRNRHSSDLDRASFHGDILDSVYRIAAQDGTRWIRISGQITRASGSLRIVGITQDATQQLRADTRRRHAADERKFQADHDDLTGLANHRTLDLLLAQAATNPGRGVALLLINLDNFKDINERLGTTIGDKLLRQMALRLNRHAGELVRIARVAGDEFAILQTMLRDAAEAANLASDILADLEDCFDVSGNQIQLGCTIGIAVAMEPAASIPDLKRFASAALHKAKLTRRGGRLLFEPAMALEMERDEALRRDMREALAQNEFVLLYQPFFDIGSGRVEGFDALLRWRHPTRGLLAPEIFMPIAEDTGWVVSIGRWTLREACREATSWGSSIKIAVSLSALQFSLGDLEADVAQALAASGLPSVRLELEVMGSLLVAGPEPVLPVLLALTRLGVKITLDAPDQGSANGPAVASCLQAFGFNKVKLGPRRAGRADSSGPLSTAQDIIGLAERQGTATMATGIETSVQLENLRQLGCGQAQGPYFSQPIAAFAVPGLIEQSRAGRLKFDPPTP